MFPITVLHSSIRELIKSCHVTVRNASIHQERRNNSWWLAYCQEAIWTMTTLWARYRIASILSSVSNSTSLAATRMLAYFKREYYSRAWRNISVNHFFTLRLAGRRVSAWNVTCETEEPFLLDRKKNISFFCQSVLALRIHFTSNLIMCILRGRDEWMT